MSDIGDQSRVSSMRICESKVDCVCVGGGFNN